MHPPRKQRNEAGWLPDFHSGTSRRHDVITDAIHKTYQGRQPSHEERYPQQPEYPPTSGPYARSLGRPYVDGNYMDDRGLEDLASGSSDVLHSLHHAWAEPRHLRDRLTSVGRWNMPSSASSYSIEPDRESYIEADERSYVATAPATKQEYLSQYHSAKEADDLPSNMGTSLGARRPRLEGPVRSATIAGDSLDPIAYSHSRHYAPTTSTYSPVQRSGHPFDQPMPLFQGESSTLPYHSPGLAGADGRRVIELEHSRRPPLNLEHETQIDMPSGIRRNDGVSPEHKRPRIGSNIGSTIDGQRPDLSNSTQHPGLDPRDEDKEGPKRRRRSSVGGSYGRGKPLRPTPGLTSEPDGDRLRSEDVSTSGTRGSAAIQALTNTGGRALKRTYQACIRCRKKKLKCDSALPRCTPCQTSNSECHQADVRRQTSYPRGYVEDLEARCQAAEELLSKILPGIEPKEFPSLLDDSILITPAQIQYASVNPSSKSDRHRRPISKETPSLPTLDSLRHLMNEDTITTHALADSRDPSGSQPQSARYNPVMEKVIPHPSEANAPPLGDRAFSRWSSSAHPVITEFCRMSDNRSENEDKPFQLNPIEYATIASELGYGHLNVDPTSEADTYDKPTAREFSMSSSDFWTRQMKAEDELREKEQRAAAGFGWTFPPQDREMARRVIDKFFEGINRYRPILDEDAFKREYGRLCRGTISIEAGFDPRFIACAHLVFALGTTMMDVEERQTKSALTQGLTEGLSFPLLRDPSHSSRPQEQLTPIALPGAAAMLDRPLPANGFVFPLGHSTLFNHLDVKENTDGIGKDWDAWPSASYFFQQGIRVSKAPSANSIQDLQKMILVYTWYSCKVPLRVLWRSVCNIATMCLELGLHEDQGKHRVEGREAEVNKQLFWTCFKLDQDLASLLGHDPSLKNSDVSYATSFVRSQGPLVAWPALSELSVIKAEILTRLYQQEPSSEQIVIAHHQLVQRLENFLSSLPSGCVDLQKVWTLKTNVLGEGEDTYTQQQYEPEEVVDTAHVMLEYYTTYNLCVRAVFMNMDIDKEARNQAMNQAMIASRSAIIAHVHLSHFASTFILTLPCNLFVDTLVLLNGVTQGLKALSRDEVQTVTRMAIQMLSDPRWSTESRPIGETARILQMFYEECFGKASDGGEDRQQGVS